MFSLITLQSRYECQLSPLTTRLLSMFLPGLCAVSSSESLQGFFLLLVATYFKVIGPLVNSAKKRTFTEGLYADASIRLKKHLENLLHHTCYLSFIMTTLFKWSNDKRWSWLKIPSLPKTMIKISELKETQESVLTPRVDASRLRKKASLTR